ncbi:tyrosine-protein phosphatase [Rubrivivax sp. RP6-9]|uniref:tyrosine-protein phosphatase n=1 Tax=Rubrivivax sp. RP6-9 TaxID=3415750 RepID=UPI003CC59BE6
MLRHPLRVFPLQGATNFRDLGGYPGDAGRPVRWRRIFRSDHLGHLTEADKAAIAALGVARALDFRGVQERAAMPYALPSLAQHSLAIEPSVVQRMHEAGSAGRAVTPALVTGLMEDLYRELVDAHAPRFAEVFQHLLDDDAPLLFHCTAGKDRTGVAAALILLALGVPRDLVLQDYLLTNELYRSPHHRGDAPPDPVMAVLWGVQPSFLDAALRRVETAHGGIDTYLRERIGLSTAALADLRARCLDTPPAGP